MSEYNFMGIVKDLQQKYDGDKYLKKPHTIIIFAMTPMMNQDIFHKLIEEIVSGKQFASLGIRTKIMEKQND